MKYLFWLLVLPFGVQFAVCQFAKRTALKLVPVTLNAVVCFAHLIWGALVAQPAFQQYATYNLCGNFFYISDPIMVFFFCLLAFGSLGMGWFVYMLLIAGKHLCNREKQM